MTAVSDSLIFRHIFSTAESAAIWSDSGRTIYYLRFEASLAIALAKLKIIPQKAADAIVNKCTIDLIDWDDLRQQTELIGYPVLGVVKQIVKAVNSVEPGLGKWAHWGATTQDVTDTATVLQLRDTLDLVSESLDKITSDLRVICDRYKSTPMAARSNLQQAVPISFGFKMARLLSTFERHQLRLEQIRSRLLVVEFGGAAGTLATINEQHAASSTSLAACVPRQISDSTERDRIAEVGGYFALLTATCSKFAFDVKLMMQTEVGEVSEPYVPHRGSSSTMPQKRNPISCAYITAMSATIRQLSSALYDAMVEDHERSTGPWEIEWITLPQICTLTRATLRQTSDLIAGLEVYPDAMQKNLAISKGAIVSEAVMMGLGPTLGRQYAHDLVYDLCRRCVQEDKPLLDLLLADEKVIESQLTKDELTRLCNPINYLGLSVEMVERVLKGGGKT
ncbi:hypothetical protein PILCRDRAFT_70766 [Piloderma croceum F 1598]|uniref:Adenylosuccinate lyase C-terminal domain-containing protein n=1 Tax=Piloderma croceum (strain F 1598) TaxID=765440 RepID=A0A0C3FS17_PILCF|nr:hypothetical protein PILCRDRAFT_70766 [Piloderma croceum F 1598]